LSVTQRSERPSAPTASQVHRRYLLLQGLRWLPRGLPVPVLVLLPLERGLTLAQLGGVSAALGLVALLLELPTSGLADSLGRKPVLISATLAGLGALAALAVAGSVGGFLLAFVLIGTFQALDSGPLDAWYVDSALAADPNAEIERGLSRAGVVTSLAVGVGSAAGGGLVALFGAGETSALRLPVLAAFILQIVSLIATATLLTEDRRPGPARWRPLRDSGRAIVDAVHLVCRSAFVVALILVELFWCFGMVSFETLLPVRLAGVVGAGPAGSLLGPANAVAWLLSSAGAAAVPLLRRRMGMAWSGFALRVCQGVTVAGMALLGGVAGVLTAFLLCYAVQGAANPVHMSLLHRQADAGYRSSIVSLNAMVGRLGYAVGAATLAAVADVSSVRVAMLIGAAVLVAPAPFYVTAARTRVEAPVPG
jgi:DHA1 family tetracycline resistance protein-like MFS transporter